MQLDFLPLQFLPFSDSDIDPTLYSKCCSFSPTKPEVKIGLFVKTPGAHGAVLPAYNFTLRVDPHTHTYARIKKKRPFMAYMLMQS